MDTSAGITGDLTANLRATRSRFGPEQCSDALCGVSLRGAWVYLLRPISIHNQEYHSCDSYRHYKPRAKN